LLKGTPRAVPDTRLERGRWNPQKAYDHLLRTRLERHRDVRPARRVSSIISGHPWHCSITLVLWGPRTTGHRHARRCTASGLLSAQPSSRRTDDDQMRSSHTTTLKAAPRQAQDLPRCPPKARFSRTTINSTTLHAMPPYVALEPCSMTVNRLPLAYKRRRRSPGRRGRTDSGSLAHFRLHPRHWHFASIKP
jgi:hypothetical protein